MLSFTQAAAGLFIGARGVGPSSTQHLTLSLTALTLFTIGLIAATLHLGQPLKAWRFFLGLKTSWLSRELLAFTILGAFLTTPLVNHIPFEIPTSLSFLPTLINNSAFSFLSIITALAAIFTSAKIYQTTPRTLWRPSITSPRFFGTVALFTLGVLTLITPIALPLFAIGIITTLVLDILQLKNPTLKQERTIITTTLKPIAQARILTALLAAGTIFISPLLSLPLLLLSILAERTLYFKAVRPLKMPGFL